MFIDSDKWGKIVCIQMRFNKERPFKYVVPKSWILMRSSFSEVFIFWLELAPLQPLLLLY